jgi:hypothetical protein
LKRISLCLVAVVTAIVPAVAQDDRSERGQLSVRLSWGHTDRATGDRQVIVSGQHGLELRSVTSQELEAGDSLRESTVRARSGNGDVDALDLVVTYPAGPAATAQQVHVQWHDLIAASDADAARRLSRDPAFTPNRPSLTVRLDEAGTQGFTVTVDQLLVEKAIWIPSLDVYLTAGDVKLPFADHQRALASRKSSRVLDLVRTQPEASYTEFVARWEDMGSPAYTNPHQQGPGHIVGLTWDSAVRKFGIDRAASVWNDEGSPEKFRFWFAFGDLRAGVARSWKSQRLESGLPVITTTFEEDGLRYEVEQFAYPLNGPPAERRGDVPMLLLQQLTVTELQGVARSLPVSMAHRRQFAPHFDTTFEVERVDDHLLVRTRGRRSVLFAIAGAPGEARWSGTADFERQQKRIDLTTFVDLPPKGSRRFVVKLASPGVEEPDVKVLTAIDYATARKATLAFWSNYVARGAQFQVPEPAVNDLFRASLWHALRLPRRHGASGPTVDIDLPYSNFAYGQTGTPWPVNHAVYVDYMLYGLRGYYDIAAEELQVQFLNNQEADGHVSGYANWLVYTPSMLYAVAQNYLLSDDRAAFERLLPPATKALDWCLGRIAQSSQGEGTARGLVRGPLNDNTGDGVWAFNQAYLFAGLDLFGRALARYGHPRAAEARQAAALLREAIALAFGRASVRSPIVQLRDGTWSPYVPAEALMAGRLLHEWYPTDVDTGATHLLRLKALPLQGPLADALLHDHEDNLFYRSWGMAQEPVYNQHATAYLLRDEPEAVVRAFYSYLASAFSHSVFEPVEHRWGQGQFFGPPSTDGAWFELYRNMLVNERDDDVLLVGAATPRAWLKNGQRIEVTRAPTYYGELSVTFESRTQAGEIRADVRLARGRRPAALLVRFRHPDRGRMRAVTVNGRRWTDFDSARDWVRITTPTDDRYEIVVRY